MTFNDLFTLLKNMQEMKHSCMDDSVLFSDGLDRYHVELVESLVTGDVHLTYAYEVTED